MNLKDQVIKEDLLRRLHRLEGQVRGVEAMITDERGCAEVLQQLSAVRSALEGVTGTYLEQMVVDCMNQEDLPDSRKELAEQITRLVIRSR